MTMPLVPPGPPPPGGVPPEVLAAWRTGEEKLYPVVMTRPDLYERALRLVRRMADELGSCRTVADLVAAWPQAAETLTRAASLALLPTDELDLGLVAGASFSMRYRELAAAAAWSEREARVSEARADGRAWVVVEQIGSPETMGMSPYRWVEMHTGSSGVGLRQSVEADLRTGAAVFALEVVACDPATGEVRPPPSDDLSVAETFSDRAEWTAAVEAARRDVEARPGPF